MVMKYILIASLLLGGCSTIKHIAVCEPVFSEHVCPEEGHGPCPFCPKQQRISEEDLYTSDNREQKRADGLGLRLVDYLHLVNTNQIER